jgi:hypothetical protein
VDISLGTATFGSTVVSFAGGASGTISDTTGTRDDLITLNSSGAIVVIEGVNEAGLPDLPSDHILIAYVHRLTGRDDIRGYDITNVPPYARTITPTQTILNNVYSNKNKLINGEFKHWQRRNAGVSAGTITVATGGTTLAYLADRWFMQVAGTSASTVYSRQSFTVGQTDVPGDPFYYAQSAISNGGDATNGRIHLSQCIEDVREIANKTVTISFYAAIASGTANVAVELTQNFGASGTAANVDTYVGTAALTTTWTKFTFTVAVPSVSGKIIGTEGTHFTALTFWMSAGSAFDVRTNTLGIQSGTFTFSQVQLETGSLATTFESRHIASEILLCQRYCKLLTNGETGQQISFGVNASATAVAHSLIIPLSMRVSPSFTSPDHTKFSAWNGASSYACTASTIAIDSISKDVSCIKLTATIATATAQAFTHLRTNATSAFAYIEADFTTAIT